MVWHERFLHTSIWVSEEGQEFENLSKNGVFFKPKTKFHHFWPPVAKLLEYLQVASPGKILSDAHAHKHVKWHYFCEK